MTKKHYEKAVIIIRRIMARDAKFGTLLMMAFIEFFQGDNPGFDTERFHAACLKAGPKEDGKRVGK